MLRLLPFIGPKHFEFPDPDVAGHIHYGKNKDELIRRIVNYRAQNELVPIEHLGIVLENYWCSKPENRPNCEPHPELKRGWLKYWHGGVALVKYVFFGEKGMVNQIEADRRSEVCAKCPKNIFPDKGPFIRWADSVANHATGGKKASAHDSLANCEICSCNLRAKVWQRAPIENSPEDLEKMKEVNCWQPPFAPSVDIKKE